MKGIGKSLLAAVILGIIVAAIEFGIELAFDIDLGRFDIIIIVIAIIIGQQLGFIDGRKR